MMGGIVGRGTERSTQGRYELHREHNFWKHESESLSGMSDSLGPHGLLQARILERVVFPFSRGSSQPRD